MDILQFIRTILKKGEAIDNLYTQNENGLSILPILKQTPRTIIKTAEIYISKAEVIDAPSELVKVFYSPNVKKKEREVLEWLTLNELADCIEQGILIKEVRFKKDGKTVEHIFYRMGYGLFQYIEQKHKEEKRREQEALQEWIRKKRQLPIFTHEYTKKLSTILDRLEEKIELGLPLIEEKRIAHEKQLLFLYFLIAFYLISCEKQSFDWKEIGAKYFKSIGGSKKFDAHKKEFLEILEQLLDVPPHCLGLISLGTITPIFFCGALREGDTYYPCDTVRALTDLTVYHYEYETDAKVLWLVENRAVLTRMAAESGFLESTSSLVIGVDGQLRSGHKNLINSVLTHSNSIKQVIIWTDYDSAGKVISDMLFDIVSPFGRKMKGISADGMALNREEYVGDFHMREREQEEKLGDEATWRAWINL